MLNWLHRNDSLAKILQDLLKTIHGKKLLCNLTLATATSLQLKLLHDNENTNSRYYLMAFWIIWWPLSDLEEKTSLDPCAEHFKPIYGFYDRPRWNFSKAFKKFKVLIKNFFWTCCKNIFKMVQHHYFVVGINDNVFYFRC